MTGSHVAAPPRLAVEVESVWFGYSHEKWVLRDVSLSVPEGSFLAIVGQSGSGKTTLLKLMAGFLKPQRGSLRLLGENLNGRMPRDLRRRLGYIPQQLGLVRSLSAIDNVLMGSLGRVGSLRSLVGAIPRDEKQAALSWLERLGLGEKADERVYRLSGGQRQRVAIARTLVQQPSVVLADEFVSDLDLETAVDILNLMRAISSEHSITFVLTMHELPLVQQFASSVVVVKDGQVAADERGGST